MNEREISYDRIYGEIIESKYHKFINFSRIKSISFSSLKRRTNEDFGKSLSSHRIKKNLVPERRFVELSCLPTHIHTYTHIYVHIHTHTHGPKRFLASFTNWYLSLSSLFSFSLLLFLSLFTSPLMFLQTQKQKPPKNKLIFNRLYLWLFWNNFFLILNLILLYWMY